MFKLLAVLAAVLVLLALVITQIVLAAKRRSTGLTFAQRRGLARDGQPMHATVVSRIDRGWSSNGTVHTHHYDLVLEVRGDSVAPYRVPARYHGTLNDSGAREGAMVPVLVDRRDPQCVMIDVARMAGDAAGVRAEQLRAAEEKRRSLL